MVGQREKGMTTLIPKTYKIYHVETVGPRTHYDLVLREFNKEDGAIWTIYNRIYSLFGKSDYETLLKNSVTFNIGLILSRNLSSPFPKNSMFSLNSYFVLLYTVEIYCTTLFEI